MHVRSGAGSCLAFGRRAALPLPACAAPDECRCRRVERSASAAGRSAPTARQRPGRGWPWHARDLDSKLASLVCERGSVNAGHVPLPLAVGAAAGALLTAGPGLARAPGAPTPSASIC